MDLTDKGPGRLWARIRTVEGLGKAFDHLIDWLTCVEGESAPKKGANCGYSSPWWTQEVEQAVQ